MKALEQLVRKNIWSLAPYSSARDEYSGKEAHIFLDANENPYNEPYNRYPDPLQRELKSALRKVKGVPEENIFLGNGSDEAIDLAYRVFCTPGQDNVVAIAPTYGMYQVCADINDVEYRTVMLDESYDFRAADLLAACDEHTKIIWICSPNNPTGNSLNRDEILKVIEGFDGIVIVDEAYIDFSQQKSLRQELPTHPNLIILQTMSKAWGSAAIRLGMAFASKEIIAIYNKVKFERSHVGGATCRTPPIPRSALNKNTMPGHLFESKPVDECTTRRSTDIPMHSTEKHADSKHRSTSVLSSLEELERHAEFRSSKQEKA